MAKQRVCIIGNSHVAAWRVGMDLVQEWGSSFETEYFAGQSDLMRNMQLRDDILVPTSELTRRRMKIVSGDKDEIRIPDYSHFVLIGLGLNTVDPVETLRVFRLPPYHELPASAPRSASSLPAVLRRRAASMMKALRQFLPSHANDRDAVADDAPLLSKPAFAAVVDSLARHSTAAYIATLLREVTDAKIVIVPQPYPSETVLDLAHWKRLGDNGALAHVAGLFRASAMRVSNDLGCELLLQPGATVVNDHFTDRRYSTSSVRLGAHNVEHPDNEPFHMNAAFGAEMLKSCLQVLK